MKVICLDGTEIDCESFRAVDSGVLLFGEDDQGEDEDREAIGFVPNEELRYVLPEDAWEAPAAEEAAPQQDPGGPQEGQWIGGAAPQGQQAPEPPSTPGGPQSPGGPQPPTDPSRRR